MTALLVAVLVVVATVPAGVAAAGTQATSTQTSATTTETTETGNAMTDTGANEMTTANDSAGENGSDGIAPGEQLAGILAVQRAEIDGELDSRSFDHRVASAASNDSKARVVADQLNESRERLETLRERRSELREAREAGNLSRGRYQAQAARLTAEIRSLQRLLNRSSDAAQELPADVKRANGIGSEEVERLRTEARNLSGDEVSDIAKRVAGSNVGNGLADDEDKKEQRTGNGNRNGHDGAPGRSGERGQPSTNESDRGSSTDAVPGRFDGENDSDNLTVEAPDLSGETPANHSRRGNHSVPGRPTETIKTNGTTETTEVNQTTEATQTTETIEVNQTTEVTEAAQTTEVTEVNQTTEATEAIQTTEATEVNQTTKTTEATQTTETTEATQTTETTEATQTTETNETDGANGTRNGWSDDGYLIGQKGDSGDGSGLYGPGELF
ncbi:hypothetical protein ACFQEV_07295 [Halopelagius fulvigenes]|uniref:DUF7096 domain-containing protein n=1 Tax=Halopelagius fulvigenes TaxID=1198324 RepID=A0ABD5U154_9EURY